MRIWIPQKNIPRADSMSQHVDEMFITSRNLRNVGQIRKTRLVVSRFKVILIRYVGMMYIEMTLNCKLKDRLPSRSLKDPRRAAIVWFMVSDIKITTIER